MNYSLPFHVKSEKNNTMLIQMQDGKFQKQKDKDTEFGDLLIGYNYVLVKQSIAETINYLEVKGVTFKPAILQDKQIEVDRNSYQQMFIEDTFLSNEIENLFLSGNRFFLMENRYLFVTPNLMKELSRFPFRLEFSLGLSDFG